MSLSAVMGTSSAPSAMGAVVGARGLDSPTYVFTIGGTEQFEEKLDAVNALHRKVEDMRRQLRDHLGPEAP